MICVEDVDLNLNRHLFYKNLEHGKHIDTGFGKSKNSYLPPNIRDEDENKHTHTEFTSSKQKKLFGMDIISDLFSQKVK